MITFSWELLTFIHPGETTGYSVQSRGIFQGIIHVLRNHLLIGRREVVSRKGHLLLIFGSENRGKMRGRGEWESKIPKKFIT